MHKQANAKADRWDIRETGRQTDRSQGGMAPGRQDKQRAELMAGRKYREAGLQASRIYREAGL